MVDSSISLRLLASLATASCLGVALYLYAKTEVPPYRTTTGPNSPFHNPLPSTLCAIPFALCSLIQHSAIHIPKSEIERFPLPHPPLFPVTNRKNTPFIQPLIPRFGGGALSKSVLGTIYPLNVRSPFGLDRKAAGHLCLPSRHTSSSRRSARAISGDPSRPALPGVRSLLRADGHSRPGATHPGQKSVQMGPNVSAKSKNNGGRC